MKEILLRIPEMIDTALQKALGSSSSKECPQSKKAREKLFSRLRRINGEIGILAEKDGPILPKEQRLKIKQQAVKSHIVTGKAEKKKPKEERQLTFGFLNDSE